MLSKPSIAFTDVLEKGQGTYRLRQFQAAACLGRPDTRIDRVWRDSGHVNANRFFLH